MQSINIYQIPQQKIANFTYQIGISNMPNQNQTIKIYKGTVNTIQFVLLDSDNKPLAVDNGYPELSVYNSVTSTAVVKKILTKVDVTKINVSGSNVPSVRNNNFRNSVYEVKIDNVDTSEMDFSTSYKWCISQVSTDGPQLFYTSQEKDVQGEVHLIPAPIDWYDKSVVLSDTSWHAAQEIRFMDTTIVGDVYSVASNFWKLFISDVLYGNGYNSVPNANSTFDFNCDNFTGTIVVQGCNEAVIPDDQAYSRWFVIDQFDLTQCNGHIIKNYKGNYTYLRVQRYQKEPTVGSSGKLNRVLFKR